MWPMPSWTRSWPAAANKACFFKRNSRPGKRVFQRSAGAVLRFSAPAAHPLHQFFRSADAGCRAPLFSRETQCKTKTVFQSSTAGKLPPGCGSQHPFRTLSGAHVLLAAAPTAPPCVPLFVAMRHLPPAGGSLCRRQTGCGTQHPLRLACASLAAAPVQWGTRTKQKRLCRSRAVESSIFRVNQRLLNWGASLARLRRARDA